MGMFAPEGPTGDGFAGEKGPTRGLGRAGGDPCVQIVCGPLVRRIWKERDSHLGKAPS